MQFRACWTLALFLILLSALAPGQETATRHPQPPAGSAPSAPPTASTPENHWELAKYFRDLAAQEQALAKSYDQIAKTYKAKAVPTGLDPAAARQVLNQFRNLAATERKAAQAAADVAAYHDRLATLVESLPAAPKPANPQDSAFRR